METWLIENHSSGIAQTALIPHAAAGSRAALNNNQAKRGPVGALA